MAKEIRDYLMFEDTDINIYLELEKTLEGAYAVVLADEGHVINQLMETLFSRPVSTYNVHPIKREARKIHYTKLMGKSVAGFLEVLADHLYIRLLSRVAEDLKLCEPVIQGEMKSPSSQSNVFGIVKGREGVVHNIPEIDNPNNKTENGGGELIPVGVTINAPADTDIDVDITRDKDTGEISVEVNASKKPVNVREAYEAYTSMQKSLEDFYTCSVVTRV